MSNFASISELNPEYKPEIVMFPNANFGKYLHIALFYSVSKFRGKCYFVKHKKRTFVGCLFILHFFTYIESGWGCQKWPKKKKALICVPFILIKINHK